MSRRRPTARKNAGFTLMEVMVSMFLMSLLCLGIFASMQQVTKAMMAVALRDEAYHLMQAEAERLLCSDYSSFVSSSDQTITSALKTSYFPDSGTPALQTSSDNNVGRVTFTRRVVDVSSTSSSKTLRVEVQWTWDGRTATVSVPLYRTSS